MCERERGIVALVNVDGTGETLVVAAVVVVVVVAVAVAVVVAAWTIWSSSSLRLDKIELDTDGWR